MTHKIITALAMAGAVAFTAACGTVATPEWEAAEADTAEEAAAPEEEAITEEPTTAPPTATPAPTEAPPTATTEPTTVPPTATPQPEPTAEPATADPVAEAIAAGNIANGQTVFNASYETSSGVWMCSSCHSITEDQVRLVGPGLYGIHTQAEERIQESGDEDVATYVINSIVNPAAYHVVEDPPYPENLMPQNYGEVLTDQELADVVAYVLSLGNPDA